jgi:hypothetical protein
VAYNMTLINWCINYTKTDDFMLDADMLEQKGKAAITYMRTPSRSRCSFAILFQPAFHIAEFALYSIYYNVNFFLDGIRNGALAFLQT